MSASSAGGAVIERCGDRRSGQFIVYRLASDFTPSQARAAHLSMATCEIGEGLPSKWTVGDSTLSPHGLNMVGAALGDHVAIA